MERLSPLDAAFHVVGTMTDATARNKILEEVAAAYFHSKRLDDALRTIDAAPNRKTILRQLAIEAEKNNDVDSLGKILQRLIDVDPESSPIAGRLARSLLEKGNSVGALAIVRNVEQPFEGDRARYDFVVKLLDRDRFDDAQQLSDSFKETVFRDWAALALAKRYAILGRLRDAETVAERFASPEKRAWTYYEAARGLPEPDQWLRRTEKILETVDLDRTNAEAAAIQRRIVGKALWNVDEPEAARQLLENSEAALSRIEDSFRRLRARCFLAKVLREIGELDSVRNYVDVKSLTVDSFSSLQQSQLLQWLAEASGSGDDWTLAVRRAAEEKDEQQRARRLVDILRRFSRSAKKSPPTGDPDVDAVLLSGEEFEEQYYSPFAVEGCGC